MYNNSIIENLKPDEVLAYFRKSRTDDPTLSVAEVLAKHEAILDEWAERNLGAVIPEENKYREVVSGETIADRPEVQKVLKLIESPKIKAILIVEVQRLSRGDLEDAGRLIKLIRYTNTLVITPMKTFDLIDEYDRDMFERELKRGNEFLEYQKKIMNRGKQLSVSQGNYIGSVPPYGYDKIFIQEGKRKSPILSINEEQANIVRMIFDMYVNQDMGYSAIANRLDELHITPPRDDFWSSASVNDMLTNIHYIGKIKWNYRKTVVVVEDGVVKKTAPKSKDYEIYDGKHQAIISEELFELAQQKRGRLSRVKPDFTVKNPLAGILYCRCGRAMILRTYKKPSGEEKSAPRLLCLRQTHCHTGSCLQSEMIDFVANILRKKIAEFEIEMKHDTDDVIKIHEKLIKSLEKKLVDIQAKELSQWEAQSDPDPTKRMPQRIFQMLNEKLLKEREETEQALKDAYDNKPTKIDYKEQIIKFQTALDALYDNTKSGVEKNNLLKACIKRIEYHREKPYKDYGNGNHAAWSNSPIEVNVTLMV